jgi:hypothetical protein
MQAVIIGIIFAGIGRIRFDLQTAAMAAFKILKLITRSKLHFPDEITFVISLIKADPAFVCSRHVIFPL